MPTMPFLTLLLYIRVCTAYRLPSICNVVVYCNQLISPQETVTSSQIQYTIVLIDGVVKVVQTLTLSQPTAKETVQRGTVQYCKL
jgi:hypothetical protein